MQGLTLIIRQGNINVSQMHKYVTVACGQNVLFIRLIVFITFKIWAHSVAVIFIE